MCKYQPGTWSQWFLQFYSEPGDLKNSRYLAVRFKHSNLKGTTVCSDIWLCHHHSNHSNCDASLPDSLWLLRSSFLSKGHYCFSKNAGSVTTYCCVLWCSQIVYICPYSLNTTIAFYFVTEFSNVAVFVCLRACHATTHSYFTWSRPI